MKTDFVIFHKHLFDFFHIWNYYLGSLSATITSSKSKGAVGMDIKEFLNLILSVEDDVKASVAQILAEVQPQPESPA